MVFQRRMHGIVFIKLLLATTILLSCENGDTSQSRDASDTAATSSETSESPGGITYGTGPGEFARYPYRSGSIEYRFSGDSEGIRRMTFDMFGFRERSLDSLFPRKGTQAVLPRHRLNITTPKFYGLLDLRAGKGEKILKDPFAERIAAYRQSGNATPFSEFLFKQDLLQSGATQLADTTLMDSLTCQVFERRTEAFVMTLCVWNGIKMYERLQVLKGREGSYVLAPTRLDLDVETNDDLFVFPEGYEILETDSPVTGGGQ